jgi:hypothetical protein
LRQAHIIVGDPTNADKRNFVVDRDEFFDAIEDKPVLEGLRKRSSLINAQRALTVSQLFVVPRVNGLKVSFYYTLFDQFERYMSQDVFGPAALDIDKDDQFALMLETAEAFAYWVTQD